MSLYVLDTDTVFLYRKGHPVVRQRVDARLPGDVAITVLTIEEQLTGWYSMLRRLTRPPLLARAYRELADSVKFYSGRQILLLTEPAIDRFNRLLALKLNVARMDLRIAAVTLEHSAILVTRNTRDFQRVPNLTLEDWSV